MALLPAFPRDADRNRSGTGAATGVPAGLLATAIALVVIWFATRTWRRGPVATSAVDVERAGAVAVRRGNIVRGVLLAVAAVGLLRAFTLPEGEPPAAEAAPVVEDPAAQTPPDAAKSSAPKRVIDPAANVGAYRLLTGPEAAEYDRLTSEKAPSGKRWFYDGPGERPVGAVLQIKAVEWDARLAEEKRSDTMTQELRNFFAGARATQVTRFEAGPWGGQLSCGFLPVAERPIVCAWTDSGTSGQVILADEKDLSEAAGIALQFRTASEKRT
ncbi:hypothetical protein [Streptomyces vinaceus]|uniref:hypothetical protein n=1 Tax=Streptomyces vinaceus TaxID=1960 RepID=UPI00167A15E3|nr:hypothetical protein [Streptomyces vinaceus]GHE73631.1 hypothetical protein GCM10017778_68660 [Streptomyces vinaceus]